MKYNKIIILLTAVVLFSSCNASRFGWSSEDKQVEGDGSPRLIEEFDPLLLNEDEIVVDAAPVNTVDFEKTQVVGVDDKDTEEKDQGPKLVPGFRINLMSGKDEIAISKEKKQAVMMFQHKVYVVFESPYYKIRLGDFLTEQEAKVAQRRAIRKGFTGAFLARSLVDREKAESNRQF